MKINSILTILLTITGYTGFISNTDRVYFCDRNEYKTVSLYLRQHNKLKKIQILSQPVF